MNLEQMIEGIPGVASATIERNGSAIVGVKVELERGAEGLEVGSLVSDVLEREGLRSRVAPERIRLEPDVPPPPPDSAAASSEPAREVPADEEPDEADSDRRVDDSDQPVSTVEETPSEFPSERYRHVKTPAKDPGFLESVIVDEGPKDAALIVMSSRGKSVMRSAGRTTTSRQTALIEAVAEILDTPGPMPRLLETVERDDGVLLVVLEDRDGVIRAGAGVIRSGFDFAFASAVWSALGR